MLCIKGGLGGSTWQLVLSANKSHHVEPQEVGVLPALFNKGKSCMGNLNLATTSASPKVYTFSNPLTSNIPFTSPVIEGGLAI